MASIYGGIDWNTLRTEVGHFNLRFSLDCSIIQQNKKKKSVVVQDVKAALDSGYRLTELVLTEPVTDNDTVNWNVRIDGWHLTTTVKGKTFLLRCAGLVTAVWMLVSTSDDHLPSSRHSSPLDPDNTSGDRRPSMTSSMFTRP